MSNIVGAKGMSTMRCRKDDRVSHAEFGPGVVIDVDARYTIIDFDDSGVRKFVSALVQLERCALPLPVSRRRRGARAGTFPHAS